MIDAHFHYNLASNNLIHDIKSIENILHENDIKKILLHIIDYSIGIENICKINWPSKILPSIMLNPFEKESMTNLEILRNHNIRFVKLLPYEQNIFYEDFPLILEYARKVEEQKMCLVICAAYGSKNIYKTNGIHLVEYLLRNGIKTPIIAAHGGMPKVFDTMLLMEEYPNLFMDTSFTLYYWWGSTIIQDYAFMFKKLSGKRIFYGSDHPNVSIEDSKNAFDKCCEKFLISNDIKNNILENNFEKFYTDYFQNDNI